MKFYIASRTKRAGLVRRLSEKLRKSGHSTTFDWTEQLIGQPCDKDPRRATRIAKLALAGIKKCDVFVLITDRAGTGMHAEFGIALAENKKIFVVGNKHLHTNIFFFYPKVKIVDSVSVLLEEIKKI
ncbi:MAG: nucleoside 2-deoxyribosyltransferase [Candidatus Pacebacteria bacterium]|nr:nucleoside 2-deoxyribosyltransferase [Candidatus Paceibacterota bacterium]